MLPDIGYILSNLLNLFSFSNLPFSERLLALYGCLGTATFFELPVFFEVIILSELCASWGNPASWKIFASEELLSCDPSQQ